MKRLFTLFAFVTCSLTSFGMDLIVTNSNDSGPGSLREALGLATSGSTIRIEYSGELLLASPLVINTPSLNIIGPAPIHFNINASSAPGTGFAMEINADNINITGLRFSGKTGSAGFLLIQGGTGNINISKCHFDNNNITGGATGGAINNKGGLNLYHCSFSSNNADRGGAIYNEGELQTIFCSFHNCQATNGPGGAIWSVADIEVNRCTFFQTRSITSAGGGIYLEGITNFAKISGCLFDSTCMASAGTEAIGATAAAAGMMNGGDITDCMMIDSPANLNAVIFGGYNNSVGAYPTNIFGLRSGGVITDGYGLEWIPVTNFSSTALDRVTYNTSAPDAEDIRRGPSETQFFSSMYQDIGAVENSRYTVVNTNASGFGSLPYQLNAVNSATQGPYLIDFDYAGATPINITAPLNVLTNTDDLSIDGFTLHLSRVPGPTDGTFPVVHAITNVLIEGPSGFQNAINVYSAGNTKFSGLAIGETTVGININNSQSLSSTDVFGCHFGLGDLGNDNNKYCDTSIVIRNDYCMIGGEHAYQRNVFGGLNGAARPHVYVEGSGFAGTVIEGNIFGLDGTGVSDANSGSGNIGVGFFNGGFAFVNNNTFGGLRKGAIVTQFSAITFENNKFGLDAWGTGSMPIETGIEINGATATSKIGASGFQNYFCSGSNGGNTGAGIHILSTTTTQDIIANYIGMNTDFTAVPNQIGINLDNADAINVGLLPNDLNFICGSPVSGIKILNGSNINIQNAVLGLDTTGQVQTGYSNQIGIDVETSNLITIGDAGGDVFIAGSNSHGIRAISTTSVSIPHAVLGRNVTGGAVGNGGSGISLTGCASVNIGGFGVGQNVVIANSGDHGLDLSGGTGNCFIVNDSIYSNGAEGVSIDDVTTVDNLIENTVIYDNGGAAEGITLNGVANNNVPRPTLLGASRCDGSLNVKVQFNNAIGNEAQVEFFRIPNGSQNANGNGEGNTLLALISSAPYPSSHVQSFTIPDVPVGDYVSCIISYGSASKSTSEFSNHIQVVDGPTSSLFAKTDVNCFGGDDGTINVNITGGVGPLTFDWQEATVSFATTQNVTNLEAGNFDLIVTDNAGCVDTATYTIIEPGTPVSVTHDGTNDVDCNGNGNGGINISVSGGTPGSGPLYTFDWDNDGTGDNDDLEDVINLNGGTYQVIAIDDNGCADTLGGLIVNEPANLSQASSVTSNYNGEDVSCNGSSNGDITTNITGGTGPWDITYNGGNLQNTSTGSHTESGFGAGIYAIVVTDANGCMTASQNVTVTEPAALWANASGTNVNCFGASTGTVTANPTGGTGSYSYSWTPGLGTNQTYNSLPANTYNVTVSDDNGCTNGDSYTVTQPASALSISLDYINDASCPGATDGEIAVIIFGGTGPTYNYDWDNDGVGDNDDALNLSGVPAGSYSIIVTDNNGCTASSGPHTINQPGPSSTEAGPDTTICASGSYTLNGTLTNIPSATWSGGTGTFSPNASVMNAVYTPSGSEAGTSIWIYLTATGGCPVPVDSFQLTIEAVPDAGLDDAQSFCNDHAIVDLNAYVTGNAGGTWFDPLGSAGFVPGTGNFDPAAYSSGTYSFHYIDNGTACPNDSAEITVTVDPLPSVFAGNDTTVCEGSNLTLSGAGADSYSWTGGITDGVQFSVLASNTYTVTGTNGTTGCQNTDQIIVTAATNPVVDQASTSLVDPSCLGFTNGSITIAGTGGSGTYEYSINEGNSFQTGAGFSSLGVGDYYLVIKDLVSGCESVTDTVALSPGLSVSHTVNITQPLCHDSLGVVQINFFGGTMPYDYTTDNSNFTTASITASSVSLNLPDGEYYIQIEDANGCISVLDTHNVVEPDPITYNLVPTDVCLPNLGSIEFMNMAGGTGLGTYDFSDDNGANWQTLSSFNQLTPNIYQTSIIDANGCRHDSTVTVGFNGPAQPNITSTNPFCEGVDVLTSNASSNAKWFVNNIWSGSVGTGSSITLPGGVTTGDWVYVADQQTSGSFCYSIPDSLQIVVVNNTLSMGPDVVVCPGDSAAITASFSGSGLFSWDTHPGIADEFSANTNALPSATQTYFTAKLDDNGCLFRDSVLVTINENGDCGLEVANAFSPDGDGINDQWIIQAVVDNPINEVYIYNRWGDQIEHFTNYDNSTVVWDPGNTGGAVNGGAGQAVTDGTYFYVIEFPEINLSQTGWVQITR